ncbi:MAG TPA: ATP-binding protein [Campylobacterales bacterium]|nr:ATP-binding protein [Campylobacterales bacterium]
MNITFSNIKTLLASLDSTQDMKIDDLTWIEPIGVALLKLHKEANPNIKIDILGDNNSINYLNTLLFASSNTHNTYTPLIQFRDGQNIDNITKDVTAKIIHSASSLSSVDRDDLGKYLQYLISEIMDNVISHSKSNIGGFVSAQYYPKKNMVQVVIVDNGIGLLKGLSNHHNVSNEQEAIQKAMEKEVTGSNNFSTYNNVQKHAGLGLYFLSKIIEYTKGKLTIVSNDSIYESINKRYTTIKSSFKGTLVAFEIYEKELDYEFSTLHNMIRDEDKEEGEDVF